MDNKQLEDFVKSIDQDLEIKAGKQFTEVSVPLSKLCSLARQLSEKDEAQFDFLFNLSGVDYGQDLGVVYHLFSTKHNHKIAIKVILDKNNPSLLSVEGVWKSANWHEREAWDMFGIKFEGHSNLIRILSPYDWEGYPLRKDYKTPEYYHGFKVPY